MTGKAAEVPAKEILRVAEAWSGCNDRSISSKTSSEENGKVRKFQMKGICEGSKMKGWRLWWLKLLGLSSKISRARKFWAILNGAEHRVIKFTALSSFEYWMHVSRGWSLRLSLQQSFPSSEFEICNFHFPWKVFPPAFGPRPVDLLTNSFIFLSYYQVWSLSFDTVPEALDHK